MCKQHGPLETNQPEEKQTARFTIVPPAPIKAAAQRSHAHLSWQYQLLLSHIPCGNSSDTFHALSLSKFHLQTCVLDHFMSPKSPSYPLLTKFHHLGTPDAAFKFLLIFSYLTRLCPKHTSHLITNLDLGGKKKRQQSAFNNNPSELRQLYNYVA